MSVLAINHNSMAASAAGNLVLHSSRLSDSVRRLSSGLRINSAADDAAGLAIRELMRADISALRQGVRNVNDAISMVQTFDGALSVIDEKLIRMKELAEQAATGTYDSTQRLMIDSEFQAMGAEINRIARATDFNGIKLLDGEFETAPVESVGPDNKTYSKKITSSETIADGITGINAVAWTEERTEAAITNPGAIVGDKTITISNNNLIKIGDNYLAVTTGYNSIDEGDILDIKYSPTTDPDDDSGGWTINGIPASLGSAKQFLWENNGKQFRVRIVDKDGHQASMTGAATGTWTKRSDPTFTVTGGTLLVDPPDYDGNILTFKIDVGGNIIEQTYTGVTSGQTSPTIAGFINATINISVRDTTPKPDDPEDTSIPDDVIRIHFGTGNDSAEDYYDIHKHDATLKGLGLDGDDGRTTIETQAKAQGALETINDAIVAKDKIRAEYGSMQNRLENTMTNLTTQAENLQAAESRLSDADIAQEMTTFVRNQILSQTAVAMLAQANSMPQMVMRLVAA